MSKPITLDGGLPDLTACQKAFDKCRKDCS